MKHEPINYRDIMNLGFNEETVSDNIYFDEHGFEYAIITKPLTKRIYLDWEKENKLCWLVRIDKKQNIKAKTQVWNLDFLHQIVDFFDGRGILDSENYLPEFA